MHLWIPPKGTVKLAEDAAVLVLAAAEGKVSRAAESVGGEVAADKQRAAGQRLERAEEQPEVHGPGAHLEGAGV